MNLLVIKILSLFVIVWFVGPTAFANSIRTSYSIDEARSKNPWYHVTPLAGIYGGSYQNVKSSVDDEKSFQSEGEMTAGVLFDYNSHKAGFALQAGLVHSMSTSSIEIGPSEGDITVFQDEYLSVPLSAKVYPFSRAARWIFVRAGVNLSYLLSSERTQDQILQTSLLSSSNIQPRSVETIDISEQREKVDIQAVAALGMLIPISKTVGITVEGAYYHGFINTDKTSGTEKIDLFTRGLSGTLGLSFSL